jgi:soluble lytic murein transglycosylase-like protein
MKSEGQWWDTVVSELASVHYSERLEQLLCQRDIHLASASEGTWESRLGLGGEVGLEAALQLLGLDPVKWGGSWRITDILADHGLYAMCDSLAAASGDPVFATGVRMSVLRESGMNSQLLALCDTLSPDLPESLLARGALYLARAQRALQRPAGEYYSSYLEFATMYPWHETASEAAYLAARYYDSERDWPRAADAYMASLRAGSFGGARGYWRGGFCQYMRGQGVVGDSVWAVGVESYPYSAWCDEMLFWRARYAGRKGDEPLRQSLLLETADRHPWEFYGLLAARRMGIRSEPFPMCDFGLGSDPVSREAVDMMSRGYGSMASQMLYTTSSADRGSRGMALALMGEHQRSLEVLRGLDFALRNGNTGILPDSLLRFYFPAPFRELTESTVSDLSVPADVVTGLMRQESYFNRWARSWVGASGLIQLMPGTAGDIARWYDLPPLSGDDFFDPASSILYGSIYLARQYSAFDGSLVLTLAAYNAGPGNAARWMEDFPLESGDPELFIEQIPLTETRQYVKHVMANSWVYGELLR